MAALPDHALFTAVRACSENTLLEQTRLQTIVHLQMNIARKLQAPTAKVDCPRQAWITEGNIGTGIFTSHFCNSAPTTVEPHWAWGAKGEADGWEVA